MLAAHGVISPDLENRLRGLGGFRNVLVHGYREIDEEKVYGSSSRTASFSASSRMS
jgi:uncharacterized protein YutE (UPF0331/DUF86 family)